MNPSVKTVILFSKAYLKIFISLFYYKYASLKPESFMKIGFKKNVLKEFS